MDIYQVLTLSPLEASCTNVSLLSNTVYRTAGRVHSIFSFVAETTVALIFSAPTIENELLSLHDKNSQEIQIHVVNVE